ncbi:MAG: right-handed parallel beta-helix repeat-containing protein, partial [Chloroflexi bacterium]|nr:right-handed parallel beta-helix repeat-containing protein [Chloroflexota bacterium]
HIDSGSTVTLLNVVASYNGTNGAYVEAQGNIDVTNSTFNENVHFNFPQDPGLYAYSNGGNITLVDVTADGNDFGAGAVLITNNNGAISVSNTVPGAGHFNGNGTFGIQASTYNGDLTLTDVEASYNASKGMYLSANGTGNIFVTNGMLVENGNYGMYASANQGDITLDTVTVLGDDGVAATSNDNLTDVGALLKTYNGGNVFVTDSIFNLNTTTGLIVISSATVNLVNVTANGNGGNGVEVYTPQTAYCRDADDAVTSVTVNVDGGTFTNNGEYGLMVQPGPTGTLNFVNPSVFGGNGLGDYLLDLSEPEICPVVVEEPSEPKDPPQIVPAPSPDPIEQDCELFSSTIHQLPNGTFVNIGCPYEGFSNFEEIAVGDLPGVLGAGTEFLAGILVSLTDADGNTILNQNGTVTVSFAIPAGSRGRTHSVLFWDPMLNDGQGGWMKLPPYEAGTSFPLHPENPDDSRVVISGVQQVNDMVTFTVNFSGVFVLTTP